ncbi:hypothetical protein [Methanolobus sp. WCC5]|uniref:hypothetical protein n=1 Tax=Methanolobus sp. WCC5 TaxID=3125785 RepID=UPI00324AE225
MSRTLSNTTASRNGKAVEKSLLQYMGLSHEQSPVDSTLEGHPLEIKSCQMQIIDSHNSNHRRSGRIVFEPEQHRYLLEHGGIYAFVVHVNKVVHHTRMIRADLVKLPDFSCNRSVPWPTARGWLS